MIDWKLLKNPKLIRLWNQRKDRPEVPANELIDFITAHSQLVQQQEKLRARHKRNSKNNTEGANNLQIQQDKKILTLLNDLIADNNKQIQAHKLSLPNIPHSQIPLNKPKVVFTSNHELTTKKTNHLTIVEKLNWVDLTAGTKLTGAKFVVYQNDGATLIRFLANFCLNFHRQHQHQEFSPPHVVAERSLIGTGQLPKLKNDCYQLSDEGMFLSPTGETQLVNLFAGQTIQEDQLPIKTTTFTECYRREAGAASTRTPGILRLHQFKKVELVWLTQPEKSMAHLEEMLAHIQALLEVFQLPYRVIELPVFDISFAAAKTYDIEVWSPARQEYFEISSISNTTDFQARRLQIKTKNSTGAKELVHTLNGSALPLDRLFVALLENHFNETTQTLELPKILQSFRATN